jgi:tetratricopeptide (TPR) repeat protein
LGEKEGIPARGDVVLEEMKRLGLLRESDKGLDVPDIYRYSFEIAPDYATAWADFLKEDSPSAREQFVRELPRLREILRASRPESLSKMATEEVERKDYGAARGKCERALELVRNAGDAHGEVEVLTRLGEISWQQAERERAREEYARAAEVARRARLKAAEADALWWAGWLDSSGGETDRALDEMSKSLALYHQIQNDDGIASCRLMLGVMNWERGRYEEASEHYKLALSTAQRGVGSSHWEINAFENLASLAEVIGNLPGALRLMILSTVVAMQRGDVVLARLRFERDGLAAKAGASSTVLEALTKTMSDAYVRDRGWGVVRETFPDKNISAPAE